MEVAKDTMMHVPNNLDESNSNAGELDCRVSYGHFAAFYYPDTRSAALGVKAVIQARHPASACKIRYRLLQIGVARTTPILQYSLCAHGVSAPLREPPRESDRNRVRYAG